MSSNPATAVETSIDNADETNEPVDDVRANAETSPTPSVSDKTATASVEGHGVNMFGIINGALMLAVAIVSGVIGAAIFQRFQNPPPQILIVDMASLIGPINSDPSLNAYEKRQITEDLGATLRASIARHAESGAIILDASMVLNAPESHYVQP